MTPRTTPPFPASQSATVSGTSATSPATTGPHSGSHRRRHSPHGFDDPQPILILLAVSDHFPRSQLTSEDLARARAQHDRGCGSRWCCSAPPWRSLPRLDGSSGSAHECSARSIDTASNRPIGSRVSRTWQGDCGHWSVARRRFCDWPPPCRRVPPGYVVGGESCGQGAGRRSLLGFLFIGPFDRANRRWERDLGAAW